MEMHHPATGILRPGTRFGARGFLRDWQEVVMPAQSKDQPPLIDLSGVAREENPHASSLDAERTERDRRRRAENEAAKAEKPEAFVAPPPD
jgi:hypothetical protein